MNWNTELIDTGVFDDGRYFDVEVEHANAGPRTSIACRVTVHNRSPEDAALHVVLPHAVVPQRLVMGKR